MYALFALRQLNARDYPALSEPYRRSSVTQLQLTVRDYPTGMEYSPTSTTGVGAHPVAGGAECGVERVPSSTG